jgi:iron complex transport system substrate-binding protein
VSLAPNITEMLFAGGCGAKVVATDNFSDYPEAVKRLPKVGGVEPDVERIAAMHADLVIASSSNVHPNLRRALTAAHVPLLVIKTDRLSEIAPAMVAIERASGCSAIVTINTVLQRQRRTRTKSPRVMFAVWTDPIYAAGRATYVDDLFALTGARNAVDSVGWLQYSLEAFASHPPDLLLYPNRSVTPAAIAELMRRANVHVEAIAVDENAFSRPGPRVVIAEADLNRILDQWERSH